MVRLFKTMIVPWECAQPPVKGVCVCVCGIGRRKHVKAPPLPQVDLVPTILSLSGPVLRDTARLSQRYPPYFALWGFWCLNMANWVRYPLPFFWAFPSWRACEVEVRYPPQKGYLSDTLWKQGKWVRYPPPRYYLQRVLRDMGGISHRAAKFSHMPWSLPWISVWMF